MKWKADLRDLLSLWHLVMRVHWKIHARRMLGRSGRDQFIVGCSRAGKARLKFSGTLELGGHGHQLIMFFDNGKYIAQLMLSCPLCGDCALLLTMLKIMFKFERNSNLSTRGK